MSKEHRLWYIAQAREQYQKEGLIEVDDNATVSMGAEEGAYVQAWVFVYDRSDETEEEPGPEDDHDWFMSYWHPDGGTGEGGHHNSEHGCHELCPACKEEVEAKRRRREP